MLFKDWPVATPSTAKGAWCLGQLSCLCLVVLGLCCIIVSLKQAASNGAAPVSDMKNPCWGKTTSNVHC